MSVRQMNSTLGGLSKPGDATDPAQQSLAEAMKLSFAILKVAMVLLLISYLFSGTFSVGSNEVAVRLRFGEPVGGSGNRVLDRGTYLAAPFPFEQVIKIDTRPATLTLEKEFWFEGGDADVVGRQRMQTMFSRPLNPLRDGSLITGDSNIAHARWTVVYRVADPVAFATNVGDRANGADLVRCAVQQGIVHAVAQLAADDLLRGVVNRELAIGVAQQRLAEVNAGLVIDQLTLDRVSAPMTVASSFDAVTTAESERAARVVAAMQERTRTLSETAGEATEKLMAMMTEYERAVEVRDEAAAKAARDRLDAAFDTLSVEGLTVSGEVARIMNEARSYRTQVVERVKAEADAFNQLLPQYERSPRIIISRLWEEMREQVMTGEVETFYTSPSELRLMLNRDPALQKERQKRQLQASQNSSEK